MLQKPHFHIEIMHIEQCNVVVVVVNINYEIKTMKTHEDMISSFGHYTRTLRSCLSVSVECTMLSHLSVCVECTMS